MQEVYLMTIYTHVPTPGIQLIVVLHGDCQLLVIVEVLLHEHHVVASLLEVAANPDAATAAGAVGIYLNNKYLLWQTIHVQRRYTERLCLLCMACHQARQPNGSYHR